MPAFPKERQIISRILTIEMNCKFTAGRIPVLPGINQMEVHTIMESDTLTIIIGTVLPLYPILLVIYQRIGRYDKIVQEFRTLKAEHERVMEAHHDG